MNNKERTHIRLGDLQLIFEICKEEFYQWKTVDDEINKMKNSGKHFNFVKIGKNLIPIEEYIEEKKINEMKIHWNKSYMKTIIFLAIYLEAFIYDYGATRLGGIYMEEKLDKLDLISKWKKIPNLVTKNKIRTDDHKFGFLQKIIKQRNNFVHNKSKDIKDILEEQGSKSKQASALLNYFKCLEFLISEIYRIDPEFSPLINNLREVREIIKTV